MRKSQAARMAGGALMLMALVASPSGVWAQDAGAMSWLAWSGCWVEIDAPADAPMTCVVPGGGGADLLTVTRDGVVERQRIAGDGVERRVDAGGCEGVEAAEFSNDGARVYTRSRLSCDGGTERYTRGLIAMVSQDEWIQVRALTVGQGSASWVKRFRPAPAGRVDDAGLTDLALATRDRGIAIESARMAASAAPTVDAIIEANGRTDPEAVRAWIVEQGGPIALDAASLVRLADAGVSEAVIDVAIAVTYPERFAVARSVDRRFDDRNYRDPYGYGWRSRSYSSLYYDPFYGYNRYSPYGLGGYGFGSGWGYGYGYGSPTVIVVRPAGEASTGRAVNGRGYTRSGARATSRSTRPDPPSSATTGSGYSGNTTSAPARPASSGSDSKGKAKPRGDGGG